MRGLQGLQAVGAIHELSRTPLEHSGEDITVRIGDGTFHIGDQTIAFQRIDANTLDISGRRVRFHVVRNGNSCTVWLRGRTYHLRRATTSHQTETVAAVTGGSRSRRTPAGEWRCARGTRFTSDKYACASSNSVALYYKTLKSFRAAAISSMFRRPLPGGGGSE